ncbi:TPA: EscU/YscU/HrcU family type III secretion system export apparatus switch protein [Escherichia coli]|nr:EscU/YscU/HrcU family type III secretion system export apparatus switch protein [Escherichia coli]EJQ1868269.1 EscU/YscU/HrcU family type III secretion system export apparatus switch protein [Escherichia coli]EJY3520179.1 EscU/YscU/HrcU family type III secretion system export apparatus switch protein [Escherichia coli]ELO1860308.1 EscU/YscU/HrcU family type III secretion system export apparatus switch protein [Escherichia coli]ELO1873360.1 EscU/YscU/HrcU family type III secretion system expo
MAIKVFWSNHKSLLFKTLDGDIISLLSDWGEMLFLLILYCLGSMIIVLIFDFIAEYFLFMKDMKMDKQEVKREYKEQEGNPEIKSKRRERIRKFFLGNLFKMNSSLQKINSLRVKTQKSRIKTII